MFEIGNSLREARLRQRLELTEIELATKIRSKYLRALEDEQFGLLPAQTYVKGFLRTYAEHLGLDGQLYVDEYNSRYGSGDEEPALRTRRTPRPRHRRMEARAVVVALSLIALVTVLVIAAKFGAPDERETAIPNLVQPPAATQRRARPAKRRNAAPAPRRANLVVTAVTEDSWLLVRAGSDAGRELFRGTLAQGQSRGWSARRLWVNVGRPGSLSWKLNGKVGACRAPTRRSCSSRRAGSSRPGPPAASRSTSS